MKSRTSQQGFTLIEIAIVLVIIGLLLGGILKGQELITSARVRSLIQQQDGIKAAFFGFQDRYRGLPGDYAAAIQNIQGATQRGDGDGVISAGANGAGVTETFLVWEHLSRSGFINGNYTYAVANLENAVPRNPYGQFIGLAYDDVYAVAAGNVAVARHNLKTGNQIPVEIVAEVDRKTDDGRGTSGSFVYSRFTQGGAQPAEAGPAPSCMAVDGTWNLIGQTAVNCGGASMI